MKKILTSLFLVTFSLALALPLPVQDEELLLYPLGQSQFIETSCDGIESQIKNYYSLCGETKLQFDLFRTLFELSVSSSSSKDQFIWIRPWKKSSETNSYSRFFTLNGNLYSINFLESSGFIFILGVPSKSVAEKPLASPPISSLPLSAQTPIPLRKYVNGKLPYFSLRELSYEFKGEITIRDGIISVSLEDKVLKFIPGSAKVSVSFSGSEEQYFLSGVVMKHSTGVIIAPEDAIYLFSCENLSLEVDSITLDCANVNVRLFRY